MTDRSVGDGAVGAAPRDLAPISPTESRFATLRESLQRACTGLLRQQKSDGHWVFEFEADSTIPSEYVLLMHFLGEVEEELQQKIAVYVRARQADHGGWPLYYGGDLDVSCSVKSYWALKLAGDPIDAPHMVRAREAILAHGGAARSNVFTRCTLALFGHVPWRAVPFLPVELILLPRWLPFCYDRISYWSRVVVVPLTILYSLRAKAVNPTGLGVRELFTVDPERERDYFPVRSRLNRVFLTLERAVRLLERAIPGFVRRRALRKAEKWFTERLNGVHGLGGVFPSMVNALEALATLGYDREHPLRADAHDAVRRLLVIREDSAYCQPCVSPIWDTALVALALSEVRGVLPEEGLETSLSAAGDWLAEQQQVDGPADWRRVRPNLKPGGWSFQYANDYYPDVDDTSAVIWALEVVDAKRYASNIERGAAWVRGMQSTNGGFGSFDIDNDSYFLLQIPFADHGALLDPPTADVSARCVAMFAALSRSENGQALARCIDFLIAEQEDSGAWFGRWGTNYIYGTWCVLAAFESIEGDQRIDHARERAVAWLESVQRPDGSWGESNDSYADPGLAGRGQDGTSYQTAWAVLGLMAAGDFESTAVQRGISYLQATQDASGLWSDPWFSAPGFPLVFYLRYTGYSAYFPLWALARYTRQATERLR